MAAGLKLVKDSLGPDALILSTRTIRNGKLGILGKPTLEITAAVDSSWPEINPPNPAPVSIFKQPSKRLLSQWSDHSAGLPKKPSRTEQALTYDSLFRLHQEPEEQQSPHRPPSLTREMPGERSNELDELKEMVKKLGQEMSRLGTVQHQGSLPAQSPPSAPPAVNLAEEHNNKKHLITMLMAQGISELSAKEIHAAINELLPTEDQGTDLPSRTVVLKEVISDLLQVASPNFTATKTQRRLALVGPTGVGKTTTLAKIAAFYLSNFSSSMALITIDTYRIAAVEQLKVYGSIMNLPVEVVISPEQLEQALLRHYDKDLILIDTAGRSPRDTLCIEELAGFLRADLGIDKHLVLSATTRREELFEAIRRFGGLGLDNIIITKTDECATLGVMLDIQMLDKDNKIPFSYITNGQRVPEDLMIASKEIVTELIMTPTGNNS